ncbi:hypothetical protein KIN20_022017 [Parelaphostrongylus tenuis]|uniref:Uncharacterized protein n=1 Tax=Parelaphostrongylus tenuis TaxID=148309 RepID=A0AAD5N592_PARTN|nr:hypothetical protein KIN20_022017 [Parelaphostrongylus tenuis]
MVARSLVVNAVQDGRADEKGLEEARYRCLLLSRSYVSGNALARLPPGLQGGSSRPPFTVIHKKRNPQGTAKQRVNY